MTSLEDGTEVSYRSRAADLFAWSWGSGQPVVLLHGSGLTTHTALEELAGELAVQCQVVVPDVRGFGKSLSRDPAVHTWRQYADDVVALLNHLKVPRAVVGGFSLGAAIALVAAMEHPDRVNGLVLAQPGFAGAEIGLTPAQEQLWVRSRGLIEKAREQGLFATLVEATSSEEDAAAVRAAVGEHDELSFLAAHEGELQRAQPFFALSALKGVVVPAMLLPGSDETHPPEISSWYADHLPRATIGPSANSAAPVLAAAIHQFLLAVRP